MMSIYPGFDVTFKKDFQTVILVPNAVVHVRDVTDADDDGVGAIALDDLAADASGHVPSGTLPIAVGRTVRFSWMRAGDGRCGSALATTI